MSSVIRNLHAFVHQICSSQSSKGLVINKIDYLVIKRRIIVQHGHVIPSRQCSAQNMNYVNHPLILPKPHGLDDAADPQTRLACFEKVSYPAS